MRIGLASDSFGNLDGLAVAFDVFVKVGAEQVFFLGGWWADVDAVLGRARTGGEHPLAGKVTRVASRAGPEAEAGGPRTVVDLVDGRICCLVHDKAALTRDDIANATLFFHGDSPRAALAQFGPRVFVTPGHLHVQGGAAAPATFGVVELQPAELVLTVFGADGAEQRRERAALGPGGGKVSVR